MFYFYHLKCYVLTAVCLFTGRRLSVGLKAEDAAVVSQKKDLTSVSGRVFFKRFKTAYLYLGLIYTCSQYKWSTARVKLEARGPNVARQVIVCGLKSLKKISPFSHTPKSVQGRNLNQQSSELEFEP